MLSSSPEEHEWRGRGNCNYNYNYTCRARVARGRRAGVWWAGELYPEIGTRAWSPCVISRHVMASRWRCDCHVLAVWVRRDCYVVLARCGHRQRRAHRTTRRRGRRCYYSYYNYSTNYYSCTGKGARIVRLVDEGVDATIATITILLTTIAAPAKARASYDSSTRASMQPYLPSPSITACDPWSAKWMMPKW